MINSRKVEDLHPIVAGMCHRWLEECAEQGIHVLVTSTYRDSEYQDSLYVEGRNGRGRIVTNARGGQSFHNYRMAFDFVPLVDGKPVWNDLELIARCGEIGEQVGLEWAGRWTKFPEKLHLQFTGGLSLTDLQSGLTLSTPTKKVKL
jgi:peptidoglycan L-alanyl-D-glutamate endopeptidase CwlK